MNQIIAMHGWAGHAGLWNHWRRMLEPQGWVWQSAERGYGPAPLDMPQWHSTRGERVVIAHSLGLHLLPENRLKDATAVVLLGCFTTFAEAGTAGRATRAGLQGMRAALGSTSEQNMLRKFLEKASAPLSIDAFPPFPVLESLSNSGRNRLSEDLGLLESCRQLPMSWPRQARVLVVRGMKDAVVSAACHQQLLDALSNQTIQVHCDPSSGHALITPRVLRIVDQWLQIP